MFWEEKIDRIKRQFSQDEFRVPFSDWSSIMKKMEASFVISSKPAYRYTNWSEGLKEGVVLRKIAYQAIPTEISKLNHVTNYWVVIVLGDASMAQRLVYDLQARRHGTSDSYCSGGLLHRGQKVSMAGLFQYESNEKCRHFDQSRRFPDSVRSPALIPAGVYRTIRGYC
jgi:hypothetical protein